MSLFQYKNVRGDFLNTAEDGLNPSMRARCTCFELYNDYRTGAFIPQQSSA